jgi:hypothetical protein
MPRHLSLLPWGELFVEIGQQLGRFLFQGLHLICDGHGLVTLRHGPQLGNLAFQFGKRGFKVEKCEHGHPKGCCGGLTGDGGGESQLFLARG